ncbi:hypothetical protein [Arthrobacter sp. KK5.5]
MARYESRYAQREAALRLRRKLGTAAVVLLALAVVVAVGYTLTA